MSITTEQITSIPELQRVIDHWEDECFANPDSARHYWLRKAIDEIRALGYWFLAYANSSNLKGSLRRARLPYIFFLNLTDVFS